MSHRFFVQINASLNVVVSIASKFRYLTIARFVRGFDKRAENNIA